MSINLVEENNYLHDLQEKLLHEISKLTDGTKKYSDDFYNSMKYLWENRGDMDSIEIFSNEQSIKQVVRSGEFTYDRLTKMEKLFESPYFARIDFIYDGDDEAEPVYIGRFSYSDDQMYTWVYDWRAPIASMYYDYDAGPACYQAPVGAVNGEIKSKRQYKIKNGRLEYALESSISIYDDILQKELSTTSDKKMKNIVATIQREQNQIIRNEKAGTLVIQGVAGSGKTSIALHRVAFFLYRYRELINAQDIIIISPNKVFADYISDVLPELGEQPIAEIGFEDIADDIISGEYKFMSQANQSEYIVKGSNEKLTQRAAFKSSMKFLDLLNDYIEYANTSLFNPKDYKFGEYTIQKEYIYNRFIQMKKLSIRERFSELAADIFDKLKSVNMMEDTVPTRYRITKWLESMLSFNSAMELYVNFYEFIERHDLFELRNNILDYADVFPYIYIKLYLEGAKKYSGIKHVVIDEMQDYTPVQFAVINKLYPCKKTILGDFGQNVNSYESVTEESFRLLYPDMEFIQLFKSYRSTLEIIEFAQRIQKNTRIEPTPRHGDVPDIIKCCDEMDQINRLSSMIDSYIQSGYSTLGIICKTNGMAINLYQQLSNKYKLNLLSSDSKKFENGITITTIAMAKGLEFDEVIIPYADDKTYHTEYDRSLLYVACTRAMHKLTLAYTNKLTGLVADC